MGVTSSLTPTMQAMFACSYGSPNALEQVVIDRPVPEDSQVLVRVHAAGLHVGDCFAVRGRPFLMRMETGWLRPKTGIPGFDVAGVVEKVGANVTRFQPGDEVFGECRGSCAEYVAASQDRLAGKPVGLSMAEAAALPTSGLAALHALRDVAKVQPGESVLINGASGGIGTLAVQIAKSFGAEVTGVCSTRNVSMVRSLGADQVIDYTQHDFTTGDHRYDCIFDNVENRSLSDVRRVLSQTGTLICNSGTGASGLAFWIRLLKPLILSPFTSQSLRRYLSVPNHEDLSVLSDLASSGKLKPVIANEHAMDDVADALNQLEQGHTAGKRIVNMMESR